MERHIKTFIYKNKKYEWNYDDCLFYWEHADDDFFHGSSRKRRNFRVVL